MPRTVPVENLDFTPPGYRVSPRDALAIAERTPAVREQRSEHPGLKRAVGIPLYVGGRRWEILYFPRGGQQVLEMQVDGESGRVLEAWTGYKLVLAAGAGL